jgi:hypothetical protein
MHISPNDRKQCIISPNDRKQCIINRLCNKISIICASSTTEPKPSGHRLEHRSRNNNNTTQGSKEVIELNKDDMKPRQRDIRATVDAAR